MSNFIITTFYTPDYAQYAEAWLESVSRWGYPYEITKYQSFDTWRDAVMYKPEYIMQRLRHNSDKNVVWIDVDAVVESNPTLFNELDASNYDLAARRLTPMKHEYGIIGNIWQNKVITTPTLWVANNENGYEIVEAWIDSCQELTENYIGDHINLNIAVAENAHKLKLRFYDLPFTYSYCPHHMNRRGYDEADNNRLDAVIVQGVASRKHRRSSEKCQFRKNIKCS
jgi:hypothetical protein